MTPTDAVKELVERWEAALPNIVGGQREIVKETIAALSALAEENGRLRTALRDSPDDAIARLIAWAESAEAGWIKSRNAAELAESRLAAAEEALKELREDAERYRWLRVQHWNDSDMAVVMHPNASLKLGVDCPSAERLDAAIDRARSLTPQSSLDNKTLEDTDE